MRRVLRRLVCSACLASSLIATSTVAYAGDPLALPVTATARDHLNRGAVLYNTGEFEKAIAEFKTGALIDPAPVFYFNLGQAYRQLRNYEAAIWNYERFLATGTPTGEVLAAVQGFVAEMKAHLADRAHSMPPTGPASGTDGARTADAGTTTAFQTHHLTQPSPEPLVAEPSRGWMWFGLGMTAAGVIGGGVTTWLAVSASGLDADAKDATRSTSDRVALQARADSRRHTALILGVGSGVAFVLGVVTLAIPARQPDHPPTTALNFGLTGNGIAFFGKF